MYLNFNNTAYINGNYGKYAGKVNDSSVQYARNAVDNYNQTYPSDEDTFKKTFFDESGKKQIKEFPPLNFNLQYAPQETKAPNVMAVLGMAFEELGCKLSIGVQELTDRIKSAFGGEKADLISAEALDLNEDGIVDLAEYSTSILLEDMNSQDGIYSFGKIDNQGQMSILPYANINNREVARETFAQIYNQYDLAQAQTQFVCNPNNLYTEK